MKFIHRKTVIEIWEVEFMNEIGKGMESVNIWMEFENVSIKEQWMH